ncbi:MAG TPA: hypothetical protein VKT28_12540 [Puia sp.]|nr:hypothetical protein [Puia sp.]
MLVVLQNDGAAGINHFKKQIVAERKSDTDDFTKAIGCISVFDAEKIKGRSVTRDVDSLVTKNGVLLRLIRLKTCIIFLRFTKTFSGAHKAYTSMLQGNQQMQGLHKIKNLGDEAFYHTMKKNSICLHSGKIKTLSA